MRKLIVAVAMIVAIGFTGGQNGNGKADNAGGGQGGGCGVVGMAGDGPGGGSGKVSSVPR
jgi:hypothetical protein